MLTHNNIWSNVIASVEALRVSEGDSCLACLPLSHILERMVDYYFFHVGVTINYAQSTDTISQDLRDVRPTVFVAVPRLYEKGYARVLERALTGSALKRRIFLWARRVGGQWATPRPSRVPLPLRLALPPPLADPLGVSKLR